jgi:hypothetical protein
MSVSRWARAAALAGRASIKAASSARSTAAGSRLEFITVTSYYSVFPSPKRNRPPEYLR